MTDLKKYQMYIDGQWVNSESEKTFESFNPATEEPWAIIPEAGANDVDRAVKPHTVPLLRGHGPI